MKISGKYLTRMDKYECASRDLVEVYKNWRGNLTHYFEWWEAAMKYNSQKIISELLSDPGALHWWAKICKERRGAAIRFYLGAIRDRELTIHNKCLPIDLLQFLHALGVEIAFTCQNADERETFFYLIVGADTEYIKTTCQWHYLLYLSPVIFYSSIFPGNMVANRMCCLFDNTQVTATDTLIVLDKLFDYYSPNTHPILHLLYSRGRFTEEQVSELLFEILLQDPLETFQAVRSWGMTVSFSPSQRNKLFLNFLETSNRKKLSFLFEEKIGPGGDLLLTMKEIVENFA